METEKINEDIDRESCNKRRKLVVSEREAREVESSTKFDGNHFRKLIRGEHPLGALRQLLAVVKNSNDGIITDYLNAGGNVLELTLVIDKLDNQTYYHHFQPVFSVISLIINKCRDEIPRLIPSTEEACKRLLRCHTPVFHSMLASNSTQWHKKAVIEMLTGMVTLSVQLAREVLCTLSLKEGTVNDLAKHPIKYDPNSVRAHFLRYVLAYFYHDTVLLIKQLLDQRNLLQSIIFAGMTADEAPLTILFLVTLKEKIVENPTISKTTKLKMFNTKIMIKLLETYTWKGSSKEKTNTKKGDTYKVSEEERGEVLARLHQLLIVLCTNHKIGIAFIDPMIGIDQKNYNDLVFTVIKAMDPYWNISWVQDLALNILNACPDLIAPTFKHFGLQEFFVPEVSLSFYNKCEIATQVIASLDPERCLLPNGSPDQLTHLTIRVVFNMNVLSCVRASLMSVHPTHRLLAIRLLNSIFQTLQRFITSVKSRFTSIPKNFLDYNQRIADFITKNVGLEEELMVAWSLGVSGDQSVLKVPSEIEYFLPLVDLLLSYNQVFPMYLPPVFVSKLQSTSVDTIDSETKDLFDIKVIKFIIMFKSIQPSETEFCEMIQRLVCLLSKQAEAKSVLRSLLLRTGYFEGVESEVDVWVLNLARFPKCDFHVSLLLSCLGEAARQPLKLLEVPDTVDSVRHDDEYNWDELIEVAKNPEKTLTLWGKMLPYTRLSNLVVALIRTLKTEHSNDFCSCKFITHLLGDILFSQVDVSAYHHILESCSSTLLDPIKQYMSVWTVNETQVMIAQQPFKKHSPEYKILKVLSSPLSSEADLLELTDVGLDAEVGLLLVRMIVFHTLRGAARDVLNSSRLIKALVSKMPSLPALQEVFIHPTVLQRFRPLQPPSPDNLTAFVMELIPAVHEEDLWLLKPYTQRFIAQVTRAVVKKKRMKVSGLLDMSSKLVIDKEEIISLLVSILQHRPDLGEWAGVAKRLLQSATARKCVLPPKTVAVVSHHPTLHPALIEYLRVFPHLTEFVDIGFSARENHLGKLCSFVLKFDDSRKIQRKLLKHNKENAQMLFPMMSSVGLSTDTALFIHAVKLVPSLCEALQTPSPPPWLCEHSDTIGRFLAQCSKSDCEAVYNCLQGVSVWSLAHLSIAKHVYISVSQVVDFVTKTLAALVECTTSSTLERAETVCECLRSVLASVEGNHDWRPVRDSDNWALWVKSALRLGETLDTEGSFLISTLTAVSAAIYTEQRQGVSTLLEMALSHSQFLPVLLAKPTPTKTALLELILTLLRLDASLMASAHVPIYLSAYSASLSTSDQLILQLLQLYEGQGINLGEWKPLLWGEPAVSFYSVRSQITPGLWTRQKFTQLLDLFDQQRVNTTITNFPNNRTLKPQGTINDQPDVYDPAFYLPMFVSMFAPSEVFFTYKTCQSGCLALTLSALASCHSDVRTIAFVVLQRFHCHLLSNTNNQDTLWLHFLDALRRGLKYEEGKVPRLSSVVSVFLARTSLVLTNPSHPLYIPLSKFVLAKPYFQLDTVPEMLPLFNSPDIQLHNVHQEWILSILRDGMRDAEDFLVCLKSMVFKVILEYFSSTLASEQSKVLILEVLKSAVSIELSNGPSAGQLLVSSYGLYPWLHSVASDSALTEALLSPLIAVLCGLLHKSSAVLLVPLLCQLTRRAAPLTEPQLTAVLSALKPYPLPPTTVLHLVEVVDAAVGGVFQHRTMLEKGTRYVDPNCKGDSDLRNYLKEIIIKLHSTSISVSRSCK